MSPSKEANEVEGVDPVGQNIDAVVSLHLSNERNVSRHQRFIELLTINIGRPWLLYTWVAFAGVWMIVNFAGASLGIRPWDPPPFPILEMVMTLAALLVAIIVLVTQNRQARVNRRQAQLDLQISLAIDQRAAKIIALLEELRRDSPYLQNRVDPEAESLTSALDPQEVAAVLENRLETAIQEIAEEAAEQLQSSQGQPDRPETQERNI